MDNLTLLKELYTVYGEELVDEIVTLVENNGQGDCYQTLCSKYCSQASCFNAIKLVILEYLGEDKNFIQYMCDFKCSLEEAKEALRVKEDTDAI